MELRRDAKSAKDSGLVFALILLEKDEIKSPGINVQAVLASGGTMGLLLRDIQTLEVNGPNIPDPEPIRLLRHAENSGQKPVYTIIPEITDMKWEEWYLSLIHI